MRKDKSLIKKICTENDSQYLWQQILLVIVFTSISFIASRHYSNVFFNEKMDALKTSILDHFYLGDYRGVSNILKSSDSYTHKDMAFCSLSGKLIYSEGSFADTKKDFLCQDRDIHTIFDKSHKVFYITGKKSKKSFMPFFIIGLIVVLTSLLISHLLLRKRRTLYKKDMHTAIERFVNEISALIKSGELESDFYLETDIISSKLKEIFEFISDENLKINEEAFKIERYEKTQNLKHDLAPILSVIRLLCDNNLESDQRNEMIKMTHDRLELILSEDVNLKDSQLTTLSSQKMSVEKVINSLIDNIKLIFKSLKIDIRFVSEGDVMIKTSTAAGLSRVLTNLIKNSIENTDTNTLVPKVTLHHLKNQDGILNIQIIDNGNGMSKDFLKKILQGNISTHQKGNGIGLSSSRQWFLSKNGNFHIESTLGKGTTIFLGLPVS